MFLHFSFFFSIFLYFVVKLHLHFQFFYSCFAFSPTTLSSAANTTSLFNISDNLFATVAKDNSGLASPFGFPKWEHNITFAPFSIKYFIVGSAPFNLFSSVITPSFNGTLKSHLTKTFFRLHLYLLLFFC